MLTHRSSLGCLVMVLVIATALVGCGIKETGEVLAGPPSSLSPLPSIEPTVQPAVELTVQPIVKPTDQPTVQPTPTLFVLGPLFDSDLDIKAGPIDVPLELQIPSLKVNAPVLGVGLTSRNEMDAPKGPIGGPVWHSAFWYRGSGIPGDPGTATIAGTNYFCLNTPLIQTIYIPKETVTRMRPVSYSLENRFISTLTSAYSVKTTGTIYSRDKFDLILIWVTPLSPMNPLCV